MTLGCGWAFKMLSPRADASACVPGLLTASLSECISTPVGSKPVATALRDSEILFDLWKETFRVVVKGGTPRPGFPGAEAAQNRVYEAADLDEAIGYATKLRGCRWLLSYRSPPTWPIGWHSWST